MKFPVLLGAILGLTISNAHAFNIKLDFPQGTPSAIDFSYAVSTGDCSSTTPNCTFSHASYGGIKGDYINKFMRDLNSTFDRLTPVTDKVNKSNFVEVKIQGQKGLCHVGILGKKTINIKINKDGSCIG